MELKLEYTQNNHFKWGWSNNTDGSQINNPNEWYNEPDPAKTFKVHLGYCTRPVQSFREECITAARLIAEKATQPIIVGLSGGSDSQVVCLSLLEAKIPFKVVIVHMYDVINQLVNGHDIKIAYEFCKKYNIEYITFNINLDDYYRGPAQKLVAKYGFSNLETMVQCATMDFVGQDYCYIMGGGDPLMQPVPQELVPGRQLPIMFDKITVPVWLQHPQPIMRHMIEMGYEGTSKYFLYTPELTTAYLTDEVCQNFYAVQEQIYETYLLGVKNHQRWWRLFQQFYKPMMMVKNWPEIIQSKKYTGFEKVSDEVKTNQGIYNRIIINAAVQANMVDKQSVVLTIPELINYLTTPHDHAIVAQKTRPDMIRPSLVV